VLKRTRNGQARNLGNVINTAGDEMSRLFTLTENSLFFLRWQARMGGLDIYFQDDEDSSWTEPKNLGYP